MDSNYFINICDALTNLIADLDYNYCIIPLEGKVDGNPIKSVIVNVSGQNYLQVDSSQFISFHELFPRTKYQQATYHCSPEKDGQYTLFKKGKVVISHDIFSIESLITEVFGDIKNKLQNKQEVAEHIGELMDRYILPNKLGYDVSTQSYFFLDWNEPHGIEYLWFRNYFSDLKLIIEKPNPFNSWHVAKYTPLDTALTIINSGKMRMMSVTAMNDKLEIGHLYGELHLEDSHFLENKTIVHNARQRYITSFTNKIDDLTMWRLYGDNGNGVCLVFSEPNECPYYLPIDYSGKKSKIYLKSKSICEELFIKHGIKFTFKSLESTWQYFLKPAGFSTEQEMRYLRIDKSKPDGYMLASNGVISSYKEYSLTMDEENPDNIFPASLEGIVLGPNIRNVEVNKLQLEALAFEKGLPLLMGVRPSSINYYL